MPPSNACPGWKSAFSLLELLCVLVVTTLLAALIVPGIVNARETANQSKCASNLRHVFLASMAYASDNSGFLPAVEAKTAYPGFAANWWMELEPYYGKLSKAADPLRCESHADRLRNETGRDFRYNYGMNYQLGYCLSPVTTVRVAYTSISNPPQTIMASEGGYNPQTTIATLSHGYLRKSANFGDAYIGGAHRGANNVLWCDGHVSSWADIRTLASDPEYQDYWKP